jgi:hypothetical protein
VRPSVYGMIRLTLVEGANRLKAELQTVRPSVYGTIRVTLDEGANRLKAELQTIRRQF